MFLQNLSLDTKAILAKWILRIKHFCEITFPLEIHKNYFLYFDSSLVSQELKLH